MHAEKPKLTNGQLSFPLASSARPMKRFTEAFGGG
jgi:hypothetical protein